MRCNFRISALRVFDFRFCFYYVGTPVCIIVNNISRFGLAVFFFFLTDEKVRCFDVLLKFLLFAKMEIKCATKTFEILTRAFDESSMNKTKV